ncbi:hypothetical protein [Nonomuraea sp. SBT364]|uniref:hypothetical protein n=1 Tax=Nonomuraea sp. SBT364 TaxID=1580530 RepID=UPI00066D70F9|nr:hypothetical protein [Nonomuraea sp. SBT364]
MFAAAVEAADPGGTAAPVIKLPGPPQLVATDPERLARVATWDPELAGGVRLAGAAAALPGPDTARVMMRGDRLRLTARHDVPPEGWQVRLFATFRLAGNLKPAAVPLGVLRPAGGGSYEWNLPLPCRRFAVRAAPHPRRVHPDGRAGVDPADRRHREETGLPARGPLPARTAAALARRR